MTELVLHAYNFKFLKGQSMPFQPLLAANDKNFFEVVLPSWEKETGFKHIPGTVTCVESTFRKVPEPSVS